MNTRLGAVAGGLSLALTLSLGLAGCGDQLGKGYAGGEGSAISYDTPALGKDEIFDATGKAVAKAGTMHLAMVVTGKGAARAVADVRYAKGAPAMSMKMTTAESGSVVLRLVDGRIYVQMPNPKLQGKWLMLNPKTSSALAANFDRTVAQLDPRGNVAGLQKAVRSAQRVGKGTLDGVSVDHYQLTVDTATLARSDDQLKAIAGLPEVMAYDVWLDAQHLIRRMSYDVAGTSVDLQLSKWGQPVAVKAPAPRDVFVAPGG